MSTGNIYIIAAASGTGKTSLVSTLIESLENIIISISHTTRPIRSNEKEGDNYFFVTAERFKKMMVANEFLEHATVFGNYYGTSRSWVQQHILNGVDVILEIDWQGAQQIKGIYPDAISIFILPPSLVELSNRLEKRKQDDAKTIEKRLIAAHEEIPHCIEFDYILVNDEIDMALLDLRSIIRATRLQKSRQLIKQQKLLEELTKKQ